MREGLLGALQLKFVMVFIFIFLIIIAAGLKYIQAFRVKNRIIDYIDFYD